MKRPTPGGLLIGLAVSVPVLIEARTLLVWLGYDVPLAVYVPSALLVVALAAAALWVFGEEGDDEGNRTRA